MITLSASWARWAGLLVALPALLLMLTRVVERWMPSPVPQLAAFTSWAIPLWVLAGVLLVAGGLRVVAGLVVVALAVQLWWFAPPRAARETAHPAASGGAAVTLMTQNVELGGADAAATLAMARRHHVDVLLIEELTPAFAGRLRSAGIGASYRYSDLMTGGGASGSGIWSRWPLQGKGSVAGTGFAMPRAQVAVPDTGGVLVTAVHTRAPRLGFGLASWRHDLSAVRAAERLSLAGSTTLDQTPLPRPQVVAGDFNASRDHSEFRAILDTGLTDAGDTVGVSDWPGFTWPADEPGPAATRLDHVLITPTSIDVRKVSVVTVPGTDHHGVVADLLVIHA